jgi:copper chaperone CopZ
VRQVPGVRDVMVNFLTGRVVVRLWPDGGGRPASPTNVTPLLPAGASAGPAQGKAALARMEAGLLHARAAAAAAAWPTAAALTRAVVDAGYSALPVGNGGGGGGGGAGEASATLVVEGFVCAACPARVAKALRALPGVTHCTVGESGPAAPAANGHPSKRHPSGSDSSVVGVRWDSRVAGVGARAACEAVDALGYKARLADEEPDGATTHFAAAAALRRWKTPAF